MARPRKEGMDYFPHDVHATGDKKIEALMLLYGTEGYAFYFILLEQIYQEANFELDVSDAETIQVLSKKIGITPERFNQILETALKRGCFDREAYDERRILTSSGVKKRSAVVVRKREKMREYDGKQDSDVVSAAETKEESAQSKGKESKGKIKESKVHYADHVSMTESQHQKLIDQYGPDLVQRMVSVLDNYKGSKGKRYKDDYRAILSWVVDKVTGNADRSGYSPRIGKTNEDELRRRLEAMDREED